MRVLTLPLACCLLLLTSGCSEPETGDPITALSSTRLSSTFDEAYWSTQAKDDSETWKRALELCAANAQPPLPNCQTVHQVHFLETLRTSADRTSKPYDGKGTMPCPEALRKTLEPSPASTVPNPCTAPPQE